MTGVSLIATLKLTSENQRLIPIDQSNAERNNKRIHVALPLRVIWWDNEDKPNLEMACTYDISAQGARITGLRNASKIGEVISIERGRNKAFYRVVWVGQNKSPLQGQVGIQSVEAGRVSWDAEMRDLEESYEPLQRKKPLLPLGWRTPQSDRDRRLYSRFSIEGSADLEAYGADWHRAGAHLRDLSELGCRVESQRNLSAGTELKLVLSVERYDLSLKGRVRHVDRDLGAGIEFREVRKGDRQMLQYLLRKLAEQDLEDSFQIEAPTEASLSAGV